MSQKQSFVPRLAFWCYSTCSRLQQAKFTFLTRKTSVFRSYMARICWGSPVTKSARLKNLSTTFPGISSKFGRILCFLISKTLFTSITSKLTENIYFGKYLLPLNFTILVAFWSSNPDVDSLGGFWVTHSRQCRWT